MPGVSPPQMPSSTPNACPILQPQQEQLQEGELDVPSPAMFVEYAGSSVGGSAPTTPSTQSMPQRPQRPMHDAKIMTVLNPGSEDESDDDSDEDDAAQPFIPRVFRATLDTPEDDESIVVSPSLEQSSPPPFASSAAATPFEPNDFLDFKWRSFPNHPIPSNLRRESFSNSNVGPTIPYVDPYDVFVEIWDQQIMEHIASETNKYAQQVAQQLMLSNNLHPTSRICSWKDTTVDELYVFFAVVLAMGVVAKGRIFDYWSTNASIFATPGFTAYMSLRRFQLLCSCLHFRDNEDMSALNLDGSEAKLFKIQPVIDHLNNRFQLMYNLNQNIALDESLLQWKGWLDINQFIPNKAAAVGIKSYEICESQTGYLWRFLIHAHKRSETAVPSSDPLQASTPSLVLELLHGLENKGHTVWMDNFYNSPALARKLKTLGFDCVGTLRTNRKFVPKELKDLTKAKMRPGQTTGVTSGDVDIMVWRDQNRVATISTYHGNTTTQIKGVTKPNLIHEYNLMMGGVDKKDQMLAAFPIERKRTKVWYKKLFRRLLNASVLNTYIICKKFNPLSHRTCRTTLIENILSRHSSKTPSAAVLSQSLLHVATVREHYLTEYDFQPNLRGRNRRVCVVCKRRVTTYCAGCKKTACMTPCFVSIH